LPFFRLPNSSSATAIGPWRFLPVSDQQAALARELIDLYKSKPRSVARAIFAAPADRIQTFADAFRLRKDRC